MSAAQAAAVVKISGAEELAGEFFDRGNSCTRSVLLATGHASEELLAAAAGFGGGIGKSGCLCGAISGGVMALGLHGHGSRSAELVTAFKERFKTTCCRGLSKGFTWMSAEHRANCRTITTTTTGIVEQLLQQR